MKVAVTGGGTGGHTSPVIAVINSLSKLNQNLEVIFIGSRFGIESKLIPKMGIKYFGISSGKFRRYHKSKLLNIIDPTTFVKNFGDFFRFINGIKEARAVLSHEKPDVLFAKGGYVSLPVGIAAKTLKIPVVIHESDVVMGLANRRLAPYAERICVTFPKENYPGLDQEKIIETGNPIRSDILMGDGERFKKEIGFSKNKKTLLVLGGSQGSLFLNDLIMEIIEKILENFQLIWITGERDAESVSYFTNDLPERLKKSLKVFGFVSAEVADVYAAADLVIGRSGSNVLFEFAALGKPMILIPYDVSAGSHQLANAILFSRSGAAYLFKQDNLNSKKLLHQIEYLFNNDEELVAMSEKIRSWANPESAKKVAAEVYEAGVKKIEQDTKFKKEE